jgi:DNA-binding CsgD family transcriptional regulator
VNFNYRGKLITLSKRESEILKWFILGKTATETGIILSISRRTVEHHIEQVKKKLGSSRLIDIFRILASHKIIDVIMDL